MEDADGLIDWCLTLTLAILQFIVACGSHRRQVQHYEGVKQIKNIKEQM
jgi:hypothetical protein